ncbi:MAG: adenylate/guanylate cyclase domain-containing protein [Leptospirales bacterium]|nr:adenylate/guanylate cyclase domain-containing protein [Leptospirales bacterium]
MIRAPKMTFGVIAALFIICLFIYDPQFFITENYAVYDALSPLYKGSGQTPKNLPVIVDIDRATLNSFGQNFLPRYALADIVSKIASNGAAAIGLDINLSSRDIVSPVEIFRSLERNKKIKGGFFGVPKDLEDNDLYLAKIVQNTPTVLAAYADKGSGRIKSDVKGPQVEFVINYSAENHNKEWFDLVSSQPGILFPNAILAEKSPVGLVDFKADRDGKIRRVPLVSASEKELYPVMAIRTLMMAEKAEKLILNIDDRGMESMVVGQYTIPISRRGTVRFPFTPGANNYEYISALEVIGDKVTSDKFAERIVFVGSMSSLGLNRVSKPSDVYYSTTELHAATLDAIMGQNRIRSPKNSIIIQVLLIILTASILLFVSKRYGLKIYLAGVFGIAAVMILAISLLFTKGLFLTPMWVFATLALMLAVELLIVGIRSASERNSIYNTFSKYVSSDIVKILVRNNSAQIAGKEQDLSVMFVDIRRFTSISETMQPNDIVDLLNRYFTFVSGIVKKYNGTIDKFMGDGMLAFWNAPVEIENHQELALRAALDMQKKLGEFNKDIKDLFHLELEIGIAIHIAPTFVGNIGSQHLLSYTIIGDSVNLASRLESMCKIYGVGIVISESIKESIKEEMSADLYFRYLDKITVYGKTQPIGIYMPMYKQDAAAMAGELDKYEEAMDLYLTMKFQDALKEFKELSAMRANSVLYNLYVSRIEHFIANPPEQDWDGCFTFLSK